MNTRFNAGVRPFAPKGRLGASGSRIARRKPVKTAFACLALLVPVASLAQLPDDLATKKDFQSFKASSADPTGKFS